MNSIEIDTRGRLIISGRVMTGIVTGVNVAGKMVLDQAQAENASGTTKAFSGFDDAAITINFLLLEANDGRHSRYADLAYLNATFKNMVAGMAIIYKLQGPVFNSCTIRSALFVYLNINEKTETDAIEVSIKLAEYEPVVGIVQAQQQVTSDGVLTSEAPGIDPETLLAKENQQQVTS